MLLMRQSDITVEDIADSIVHLSRTLCAKGGVAIRELAARTGYLEWHNKVGEPMIRERLELAPDLIKERLLYSENKRTRSGWFLRLIQGDKYEVGYYGRVAGHRLGGVYTDEFKACARFIKNEMEAFRNPSRSFDIERGGN